MMTTTTTTTMTTTTMTTTTDSSDQAVSSGLDHWKWLAVIGMVVANATIALLSGSDGCSMLSRLGLFAGWVVFPVVSIASLGVVAATTNERSERIIAGALGGVFVVIWLYGLVWSSVGLAIDGSVC